MFWSGDKNMNAKEEYILYLKQNYEKLKNDNSGFYCFEGEDDLIRSFNCACDKKTKTNKQNKKIITNLLPQPLCGDLNNGSIFICSLNPGFDPLDLCLERQGKECDVFPDYRNQILDLLCQDGSKNNSMFFISEKQADEGTLKKNSPGSIYWRKRLNQTDKKKSLVNNLLVSFNKNGKHYSEDDIFDYLAKQIVTLELFPYHSTKFDNSLLNTKKYDFKSVRLMRNYVLNYLVPQARKKSFVVIFLRSIRQWDPDEQIHDTDSNVIINNINVQNPYFSFCGLGEHIYNHIKNMTDDFSAPI